MFLLLCNFFKRL
uniref:Uncharacterized protein MANES_04G135600 n=1 Tax=Rhizophora mucronata TaxID=61149 RepID=A0A2P2JP04_RHIMU